MMRKILSLLPALFAGFVLLQAQPAEIVFRVSPEGSDAASGTPQAPWQTPEAAAVRVQAYMKAHPGQAVRLEFAPGRYQLSSALSFEGLDAPLTIAGNPAAGEALLSGEVPVRDWQPVTDRSVLRRLPASAAGRVLQADLRAHGIRDFGDPISRDNRIDLYCNGQRQTLARWPDAGFIQAGRAVGATDLPDTWIHVHGTAEGVLEYCDERLERWVQEPAPLLFGYWYWDWADKYHRLTRVDAGRKVFTVDEPWSHYGYRDSCRYYGLNLLCELDAPGEYYVDRERGLIYWIVPEGAESAAAAVSVFAGEAMVRVKDCNRFTISGLAFEGGRRGAVQVRGGEQNKVCDCRFTRFGETVLCFEGGRGHAVQGCLLTELGCGGISMAGGDRQTLEPAGFEVSNTIVEHFSLFKRTYEPAVYFRGTGLLVSHNRFRYSSSSALRVDGSEVTVEYNQCFDLVEESDDQGGIDTFMDYTYRGLVLRYNHWRDIRGGMYAGAAGVRLDDLISGALVHGNVFERCGGGGRSGGGGFGAVQINGGRDNRIFCNVFYDCPWAVSGCALQGERWAAALAESRRQAYFSEVDLDNPAYAAKYPLMRAHAYEPEGVNYFERNLVVNAQALLLPRGDGGFVGGGNALMQSDQPLSHFLQPRIIDYVYGINSIPFSVIGVEENRWK